MFYTWLCIILRNVLGDNLCVSMSVCVCMCTLTCMYPNTQNLYTVTESLFTEFLLLSWASFMFTTALSLPPSVGKLIWKTIINVEVSKVHWSLHSADPHLPWGLCTGGSFCVGCSPCDSPVTPSLASKVLTSISLFHCGLSWRLSVKLQTIPLTHHAPCFHLTAFIFFWKACHLNFKYFTYIYYVGCLSSSHGNISSLGQKCVLLIVSTLISTWVNSDSWRDNSCSEGQSGC